jgi:uncharacterized protein
MRRSFFHAALVLGISIGLGITIAGLGIAYAIRVSRLPQRSVEVKGLAEREVDADLAIWPITVQEVSNDLTDLFKRIDEKRAVVQAFLAESGFKGPEISFSAPRITDRQTQAASETNASAKFRYTAVATVTLCSSNVPQVMKTIERSSSLVGKNVVLVSAGDYDIRTRFLYTGLNKIKPQMIEEATRNAREAAAKFAEDSGSKVGKIKDASQGLFDVSEKDPSIPNKKIVRVVTTVDYFLVDK